MNTLPAIKVNPVQMHLQKSISAVNFESKKGLLDLECKRCNSTKNIFLVLWFNLGRKKFEFNPNAPPINRIPFPEL